uniref:uncharacterized protein LOC109955126 n=1 Tax=Monopterus albus TaxID=43700 RepID=UPI0009B35755|nr:uncharacterized protein LOC109955126 [Monopterus albus]
MSNCPTATVLAVISLSLKTTVKFQCTLTTVHNVPSTTVGVSNSSSEGPLSLLELVATPNYPVAAGQTVKLHCSAVPMWDISWQHLENQTWQNVSADLDLTLTEPQQSGLYRCCAKNRVQQRRISPNHTVYIVAMQPTVGENLGITAFVLSLLALIINIAILFWLGWQRFGHILINSSTAAKGFPGPENSPTGGLPQTESERDVYINYTRTDHAYTDLDPANVIVDNVYSSLS